MVMLLRELERIAAAASPRSLRVNSSQGSICATCQRSSCWSLDMARRICALNGCSGPGCCSPPFARTSAARILISGSSCARPGTTSASSSGFASRLDATWVAVDETQPGYADRVSPYGTAVALHAELRTVAGAIPTLPHVVLAAFIYALAHYHARGE